MSNQRTHYVTTTDGVTIGATVHGQGPPLVLLQGAVGDGDIDWDRLVVTGRPVHLLSAEHAGPWPQRRSPTRPARQVDDILTYVDSIGEPTGLVGWSGGANLALAVAAQSDAVHAVAPFEPGDPEPDGRAGQAVSATPRPHGRAGRRGQLTAAVRAFLVGPATTKEIAVAEDAGVEAAGRYVPNLLNLLQQVMEHGGPPLTRPCSARSPLRWRCCTDRTPSPSSPPARGTWPTTSPTHGCTRSPASGTPPP